MFESAISVDAGGDVDFAVGLEGREVRVVLPGFVFLEEDVFKAFVTRDLLLLKESVACPLCAELVRRVLGGMVAVAGEFSITMLIVWWR